MKLVKWLDKHLEEILLVALLFVMMIIMGILVALLFVMMIIMGILHIPLYLIIRSAAPDHYSGIY